ncbi:hypothetical protein PIB30_031108 [Stylosanthes scabra]|uniref:RRM domain-containing protein n=1 Tax=Stylosanthes scabra TaxID=79078 RepID=A0ABU6VDV5_9FABA|nr:hypothetical protein [Stylosanthes scabra]
MKRNTVRDLAMRERDVRKGVWFERGKQGEGSSYAGGRNKGDSGGGLVLGARRLGNLVDLGYREVETHTIFVDGLPGIISKRELYKAFGRFGFISDIFISRKARRSGQGPFAFIRYNAYGGALKAIESMNDMDWQDNESLAKTANYPEVGGSKENKRR